MRKTKSVFRSLVLASLSVGITEPAYAEVNMWTGGFSKSWTDLQTPGSALMMKRTYSSRSLRSGLFGFGWCTDFETKLTPLPDGGLRLQACGGEVDFERHGERWLSPGSEAILFKNASGFERVLADGSTEVFDLEGRLSEIRKPDGEILRLKRNAGGHLDWILSSRGTSLRIVYDPRGERPARVEAGSNTIRYQYRDGNLMEAADRVASSFSYCYDALHNLTRVDYRDGTFETVQYQDVQDRVVRLRDREGCSESYEFEDHQNKMMALAERSCRGRTVSISRHEFWHRTDEDGHVTITRARVTNPLKVFSVNLEPRTKRGLASSLAPRLERRH